MYYLPYTSVKPDDRLICTYSPSNATSIVSPAGLISLTHSEILPGSRRKCIHSENDRHADPASYSAMIKERFQKRYDFRFSSQDPTTLQRVREQLEAAATEREPAIRKARKEVDVILAQSLSFSEATELMMSAWSTSIEGGKFVYTDKRTGKTCSSPDDSALFSAADPMTEISVKGGAVCASLKLEGNGAGKFTSALGPAKGKSADSAYDDTLITALKDWEVTQPVFSLSGGLSKKNRRWIESTLTEKQEELRRYLTASGVIDELEDSQWLGRRLHKSSARKYGAD